MSWAPGQVQLQGDCGIDMIMVILGRDHLIKVQLFISTCVCAYSEQKFRIHK